MSRHRVILIVASVALLASLSALVLELLRGGYTESCGRHCVIHYFSDYWQLLACAVAAAASLALIATSALAPRPSSSGSGSAPPPLQVPRPTGVAPRVYADGASSPRRGDDRGSGYASPLENKPWLELAEECAELVDELDRHGAGFDPPRREVADHVIYRVEEILERSGVEKISGEETFDRSRHKPERVIGGAAPGAVIAETLSPGFAVGPRVLRRARVRLEPSRGGS